MFICCVSSYPLVPVWVVPESSTHKLLPFLQLKAAASGAGVGQHRQE
jgi:hypothetical protein